MAEWWKRVAAILAEDIPSYTYVNLGVGIPTACLVHLRNRSDVMVHTENGSLGARSLGPDEIWDGVTVDPSKAPMTYANGASIFDSHEAFRMINSGRIDLAIMGAYEVSRSGDIANWQRPGTELGGVGGAADLCRGAKEVWVIMPEHTRSGNSKFVESCEAPLTARAAVTRLYTDRARYDRIDGVLSPLSSQNW